MNLEHHFDIIRHSPSLEEYSLLQAFQHYVAEDRLYDAIILDMPPTALTLRFFNLPRLSLIWLNELGNLRRHILEKKETITRVKGDRANSEPDKIQMNLNRQIENYQAILKVLCDPDKSGSMLVVNPDALSTSEAQRVLGEFQALNMPVAHTLINKSTNPADSSVLSTIKPITACCRIPFSSNLLVGVDNLNGFLDENMKVFDSFLQN